MATYLVIFSQTYVPELCRRREVHKAEFSIAPIYGTCLLGAAGPGPAHTAAPTQRLAAELNIQLIWLPKQWPEWNAMDQLWRELKRPVAANRHAEPVDHLARQAENW